MTWVLHLALLSVAQMRHRLGHLLVALTLPVIWAVTSPPQAGARTLNSELHRAQEEEQEGTPERRRVPCSDIISEISHQVGALHGQPADMSQVAKRLGTTVPWVEHCMLSYGRRPNRPGSESAEVQEERLEHFEEDEAEESGPEDVQEPGARERPEHPDKEHVLSPKEEPTPAYKLQ